VAVLLDPGGAPQTRTGRWLKALTPQSILGFLPAASIVGLPLSFVVALNYELGRAVYYGIPQEFVRVGPVDAIAPFIIMALLVWLLFIVAYEVERVGLGMLSNFVGATLRLILVSLWAVALIINFGRFREEDGLGLTLIAYAIVLLGIYVALWWLPRGIAWIGRWFRRAVAEPTPPPGRIARHFFGGVLNYRVGPGDLLRLSIVVLTCFWVIGAAPALLGRWDAQITEEFTVITVPGRPDKQVILAVYADKTFTAELEDRRIRTIMVRQTADLKDMQVRVEHLGRLRPSRR
jgi:hypothetical protein